MERNNNERIEDALRALLAHDPDCAESTGKPEPTREYIVDLFANLIHLCHREGIDHVAAFGTACGHFEAEK